MDVYHVIRKPHNSEKSHESVQEKNTYVFEVDPNATKTDVKTALKTLWNVDAKSVRTVTMPSKAKRFGRIMGRTSPWKKAIVRLAEGQAIDALR